MSTKRIFIAFAKEDESQRNLLKGQSLHTDSPFEYVDLSVKEPYQTEWKERVRTRIRSSDGVIVLVSRHTAAAAGQLWEIRCAIEEGKPVVGLWAYSSDHTRPSAMAGVRIIEWSWPAIASFIDAL